MRIEAGRKYVRVVEGRDIRTYRDAAPEGTPHERVCGAFVALVPGWVAEVERNDLRAMVLERVERIACLVADSI